MFNPFIWTYIIPMMMISPFLVISMNQWFSIWMMLEFNLMTFIPLIIFSNKSFKETAMKYFIIQSISSSILLISSNSLMLNLNMNNYNFIYLMNYMINLSLLIKIGAAPFHYWFINMMNNLNWFSCFLLSTWQKINPMILIMYNYSIKIMMLSIIYSSIMGAIYGLNHQSLRLILSYSSINHISWMLLNSMISEMLWILYFFSYFMMNACIMFMFNKYNIKFINQMFLIKINFYKLIIFNLLSISGLPPFFGFLMKWFSMYFILQYINFIIILIMTFMSLMTFIFYTRMSISMMMMFKMENKSNLNNLIFYNNKISLISNFIILLFLNIWIINMWMF